METLVNDFYNEYDSFARIIQKEDINSYITISRITRLLDILIKVYEAGLSNEIDKAILYNTLMCAKLCERRIHYIDTEENLNLKNNLIRLSDLKYNADNNIKR